MTSSLRCGVVVFPGSNCDSDLIHVLQNVVGIETQVLWHKDRDLKKSDVVFIPGGFSYGDYLRCGAIARFSPVMEEVAAHAKRGGKVIGICNGFQVLTEAGLLPGALLQNASLRFLCQSVPVKVEQSQTLCTQLYRNKEVISLPIAHAEGNYCADDQTLARLEGQGQIVFRYQKNPNGSRHDIAGIVNEKGNVVGLMPHPERASENILGNTDGLRFFQSLLS